MKRRKSSKKRPMRVIRLWSRAEAEKAVPYLRSVVRSLREHWLDLQGAERESDRLAQLPGRPTRDRIVAGENAQTDRQAAHDRFEETLQELSKIDIFLLDPINGVALIPFGKNDDLAWFVYDQFDEAGLVGWRLHKDPMMERRAFDTLDGPAPTAA